MVINAYYVYVKTQTYPGKTLQAHFSQPIHQFDSLLTYYKLLPSFNFLTKAKVMAMDSQRILNILQE